MRVRQVSVGGGGFNNDASAVTSLDTAIFNQEALI